jgi:phosphoadenosine phosphosulfate reductase
MNRDLKDMQIATRHCSAIDLLVHVLPLFRGRIALASSLGAEDQVLTDMICRLSTAQDASVKVFTLDTGRLPEETYDLIERTRQRYGIRIEVLFPDHRQVESMVGENGPNLFYESIEKRKLCCRIRKIEPLKRRLASLDAWICGLRTEQSPTRAELKRIDWDETFGLIKICPLADWTTEAVWEYIRRHDVPYSSLHCKGYPSIGCTPCTRGVQAGQDMRAGRWWWEAPEHKECGLHLRADNEGDKKGGNA